MTQSTTGTSASPPLPSPKERRRLREAKSLSEAQVAAAVGSLRPRSGPGDGPHQPARTQARGVRATDRDRWHAVHLTPLSRQANHPEQPAESRRKPDQAGGNRAAGGRGRRGFRHREGCRAARDALDRAPSADPRRSHRERRHGPDRARHHRRTRTDTGTRARARRGRAYGRHRRGRGRGSGRSGRGRRARLRGGRSGRRRRALPAEAFDALYRHTAAALYRQTYLLTGRRALSREAVGKAFELAWQRWPEVAVDRDPVGWVRAAAYEHAMSPWHRLRREHRHPDPPPEAPGPRALLDALLALPPSYRRTLLLHDGVGLGLPETAAETEASTPAAAGRLVTARAAVAEQLPELAEPPTPAEQSALLHEHLGALALAQPASSLPVPDLIRTGSERKAQLWTRAAIAFTVLLIGLTLITLATAPRRYETPQSPPQRVEGVPPLGGPQKLTPQDKKLQKKLGGELVRGPGRLVPRAG